MKDFGFGFRLCVWAGLAAGLVSTARLSGEVVINEIHYAPDVPLERVEFVELYNPDPNAVSLADWSFTGGIAYTFPTNASLGAGGYVVVAQAPAAFKAKFGVDALGPWTGRLNNDGDRVVLRDPVGKVRDEVEYQLGFPWPTVGDAPGNSIELINPALDNNLAGSWRSSPGGGGQSLETELLPMGSSWKYFKGTSEASAPREAWREPGFDAAGWPEGTAPIGYGESFLGTRLDDMRYNYTTVYFRKTFQLADPGGVGSLRLDTLYDDGFIVWINGNYVTSREVSGTNLPPDATAVSARENYNYEPIEVRNVSSYLRAGENVVAVQALNVSLRDSTDFFFDLRLVGVAGGGTTGPTPGARNANYRTNAPPQIRQVDHSPQRPASGQPVRITAKVTDPDGVGQVTLLYQVVEPGRYIELTDPEFQANWVALAMHDDGTAGDAVAGDGEFAAEVPASVQTHRRLVRYFIAASDTLSESIKVPYADDPQPNFAYFVYDGVPAWSGAIQPGSPDPARSQRTVYGTNLMNRLPVYHLLAKTNTVFDATFGGYGGDLYLWAGTLVYDGRVYDHIHYRARGGVWRYSMGKNMWKFDFNRGHDFEARDLWGRKYGTSWTKLNLGACIQQGDYLHRGEQGMFESVGFRLFNLAGLEASKTHFIQFRIIDGAEEASPTDQYNGDLWGLYLAVEQDDGRFLQEHGLPDGNYYKMENGTGELNNVGEFGPLDKSDLEAFQSGYWSGPAEAWWRANLDLGRYYSYQAVVQGIHHYDICYQKNYFYYRRPDTGRWSVHPWDLDLTWADNMYDAGCGGNDELKPRLLGSQPFKLEWANHIREFRDLLFNTNQTWRLIDEYASFIYTPGQPSFVDADRAQWDYNPIMKSAYVNPSKAGVGRFYQAAATKDFPGMLEKMKQYVVARGKILDNVAADLAIPDTPLVEPAETNGFPVNRLAFRVGAYAGANAFAALKWRLGEVSDTNAPAFDPGEPRKYEIEPLWETGDITDFHDTIQVPAGVAKVGHAYRLRARFQDVSGRWSHWSDPVEFVGGEPDESAWLIANLRVAEVMYHPAGSSDLEFVELVNLHPDRALNLAGVTFTEGIGFTFPTGASLAPAARVLVVRAPGDNNFDAFRRAYALDPQVPVFGSYSGNLANGGERLTLKTSANGRVIATFDYGTGIFWPAAADGAGHSLVCADLAPPQDGGYLSHPQRWQPSQALGGSPGTAEPAPVPSPVLNEIMAHTDYSDPQQPEYDSNDWIELYNPTSATLALKGFYLSDDPAALQKWPLPDLSLKPGEWIVFDEVSGFHHPLTNGFGLNKAGEALFLSRFEGTGPNGVADAVRFKGQAGEWSLGRFPDGSGAWTTTVPTRLSANQTHGPEIVISEVRCDSPETTNQTTLTSMEYVELVCLSPRPLMLSDTNGAWRINGEIEFDFPTNLVVSPLQTLVLVAFDPLDQIALQEFKNLYPTTASALILGGYRGKLSAPAGCLTVERPQAPDLPGDPVSWVVVDGACYGGGRANATSEGAFALAEHRTDLSSWGTQAAAWRSAAPSPGVFEFPVGDDLDRDGLPSVWEVAHGLNPVDSQGVNGADGDLDQDGLPNLMEYALGADPSGVDIAMEVRLKEEHRLTVRLNQPAGRRVEVQKSLLGPPFTWETVVEYAPAASTQVRDTVIDLNGEGCVIRGVLR